MQCNLMTTGMCRLSVNTVEVRRSWHFSAPFDKTAKTVRNILFVV